MLSNQRNRSVQAARYDGTYVYIVTQATEDFPCKVGMSDAPEKRVASLQAGSPNRLVVREIYWFPTRAEAAAMERAFHDFHAESGMNGEWFGMTFDDVNYWLYCQTTKDQP